MTIIQMHMYPKPLREDRVAVEEDRQRQHHVLGGKAAQRADERQQREVVEHHQDLRVPVGPERARPGRRMPESGSPVPRRRTQRRRYRRRRRRGPPTSV